MERPRLSAIPACKNNVATEESGHGASAGQYAAKLAGLGIAGGAAGVFVSRLIKQMETLAETGKAGRWKNRYDGKISRPLLVQRGQYMNKSRDLSVVTG